MYGLIDEHGIEITPLKWKTYYKYQVTQFDNPVAAVSEDGEYYYFINPLGDRVSLFSFSESFAIEDTRMQYEGDMKVTYGLPTISRLTSNYRYYLNEDCACDPRPYYPCPARFPMDTSNTSEVINQVQQMHFVLEFYTIDSALIICDQLIDENPREPQYHHYKAWFINQAYAVSYERFNGEEYDDEFPKYIWDELVRLKDKGLIGENEKLQMYLDQYELNQIEIKKLESRGNWIDRNAEFANKFILDQNDYYVIVGIERYGEWRLEKNIELRTKYYYQAIDALTEVLEYEKEEEVVLLTKAWQNRILEDYYWNRSYVKDELVPFESVFNRNEEELMKSPRVYDVLKKEKFGSILRFNAASRNGELGFGLGFNPATVTRINRIWTTEISAGLGYNHYFLNNTYGEYFLDFTLNPAGWIEVRLSPSIVTNYGGTTGVGFLPSVGLRIWDIYLSYGYNLVKKSKFEGFRGHSFGVSYGFMLFNSRSFIEKEDGFEL